MEDTHGEYGHCRVCDGPTRPGYACCFCCATLVRQLQMPLAPVTAAIPYQVGDWAHRLLRGYKDAPLASTRASAAQRLAAIVRRWLVTDDDRLRQRLDGRGDVVVTVPSSRRPMGSPVDALVALVPPWAELHRPLLARGPVTTGHLMASRQGFVLARHVDRDSVAGCRALVVDDTITTGARAQSAVAALRLARVDVAGVVVVGRVVAPETVPWEAAYWEAVSARLDARRAAATLTTGRGRAEATE